MAQQVLINHEQLCNLVMRYIPGSVNVEFLVFEDFNDEGKQTHTITTKVTVEPSKIVEQMRESPVK